MVKGTKEVKVFGCARCGKDHDGLIFRRFTRPIVDDFSKMVWPYWALCPETKEPVIMRETDIGDITREK